ncbi:MAG TPA: hypothetical protein VEW67_03965 [Thermoleophilaceae bacterium]|nr:hypothetical protein [Thermoleophilaceae bacterium]
MDLASIAPVVAVAAGLGTLLFAALRHPREEATAVVEQQSHLMTDMRGVVDELQEALERCRDDREWCRSERRRLETRIRLLEQRLTDLGQEIPS